MSIKIPRSQTGFGLGLCLIDALPFRRRFNVQIVAHIKISSPFTSVIRSSPFGPSDSYLPIEFPSKNPDLLSTVVWRGIILPLELNE